jgi:DNA repair photolyase
MRWQALSADRDRESQLPAIAADAVVRTFDAPEAVDTRFYEIHAKSALNRVTAKSRMPFRWTVNPYRGCSHACAFCFARPTHNYLGLDAGRDFEREIVVKVNAPELVRAELSRKSWKHEHVALGTNTDPYQWVEGRYRLMTGIWEALRDSHTPCSLVTKSPLVLRDLPVLAEIAERTDITVYLSVPTIDERAWRSTEPHTPSPRARLDAVRKLNDAGVPAGILIAPLMPGINDQPEQIDEIVAIAEAAGAVGIGSMGLHLRDGVREIFFAWLRQHRPDLIDRYERLYSRGAYLPATEQKRMQSLVRSKRRRPPRRRDWIRPRPDDQEPSASNEPPQQSLF